MKTYYIVKKIGSPFPDLITDTLAGAAAHAQTLNSPGPHGYIVVPTTEKGLRVTRENYEKSITNYENAIEDISSVLGDRAPRENVDA